MSITGGFGLTLDLARGTQRRWVMGCDGIKRWADDGKPVDPSPTGATAESRPLPLVSCQCRFGKGLGCWYCGGRQ